MKKVAAAAVLLFMLTIVAVIFLMASLSFAVTLTWDLTPGVTYTVYAREQGQTEYQVLKAGITAGSYTFTPPVFNKVYEYSVKAFNECGTSSEFLDPLPFNECLNAPMAAPTGVKVTATTTTSTTTTVTVGR